MGEIRLTVLLGVVVAGTGGNLALKREGGMDGGLAAIWVILRVLWGVRGREEPPKVRSLAFTIKFLGRYYAAIRKLPSRYSAATNSY